MVPDQSSARSASLVTATRAKSGLVRTASTYDAFVFALAAISVGIMLSWGQFFGTSSYPGANILLALAISTLAALSIAWGYQHWGMVFPRSGGDFVFLSRGLHPGIGFGVNVVFVFMVAVSPALAMGIMQPLWVSFAAAIGTMTGIGALGDFANWLNGNPGFALIGTIPVVITGIVGVFGLRAQLRWLGLLFVIGLVGGLILIVALFLASPSTFIDHLNSYAGVSADNVQSTAAKNGFAYGGFDLGQTFKLTNWFAASLFFVLVLTYIGGEIKNANRSFQRGMMGAILFSVVMTAIFGLALDHAVDPQLQGALAFNAFVAPTASTPNLPYAHELMRILWGATGPTAILTILGYLTMMAWVTIWWASLVPFAQRAVLAWSLDKLIPSSVSKVNPRYHTSLPSLLIACLMIEFFILAFAFFPGLRTIALLIPIYTMIGITMAVGIFFPYVRKSLFEQSVVGRSKLFGIPTMSVACALGTIVMVVWTWLLWVDPVAAGTDRRPIVIVVILAALVAAYYFFLRSYRRRQGVDLSATFKQIPIE